MTEGELVQRGRECEANGDLQGAEAAYREADSQGGAEGAILLGLVLKKRGDASGAADAFRRSESRGHPEAAGELGSLLDDAGDTEAARAAYERSIAAGGRLARLNLGLMLAQRGAAEEALSHLRIAEEDGDPTASWAIGKIMEDRGDFQAAIPAYERAADAGDPNAAFGLGAVFEAQGDRDQARAAMQRASELGHEGATEVLQKMAFEADAATRVKPLAAEEERLLQTVHRADGNRNRILLTHRRPSDDEVMGTGSPVNFIAIIRSTDQDPSEPPFAWQRGPTEASIYEAVAEAFVNAGSLPGSTVSLQPDLEWFVDRIREARGSAMSPAESTNKLVELYAATCGEVMATFNACLEVANRAIGARKTADIRPQHEISIRNFTTIVEKAEQELPPLYEAFDKACSGARDAAAQLRRAASDPLLAEMKLAMAYEGTDVLDQVATAKGILGATFGPTPDAFIEGLERANALIQNPPDEGNIYWGPTAPSAASEPATSSTVLPDPVSSSQADERACPWCAETIKSAAVICRFCGRDVDMQTNVG